VGEGVLPFISVEHEDADIGGDAAHQIRPQGVSRVDQRGIVGAVDVVQVCIDADGA